MIALGAPAAFAQAVPAPQPTAAAPAVEVTGFRSARFGMAEAAVRKAVATDFANAKIEASENPAERTKILSVRVPDVLEGGGSADVSYVFGHSSQNLTQVSVLWSGETDPTLTGEKLVANGNVLRAYFLSAGYKPDTIVTDAAVPEGLLMFRGSDAEGRMAVLLLRGGFSAAPAPADGAPSAPPVLTPVSLLLAYIEDPQAPDVFKPKPGQF